MKKILCLILCVSALFLLAGCGQDAPADAEIDLTKLSSTMVYSELANIVSAPDDYLGKTLKMCGTFSSFHSDQTNLTYYSCNVSDVTACCNLGLEFVLRDGYDYPEEGAEICIVGTFSSYQEGAQTYFTLLDAALV